MKTHALMIVGFALAVTGCAEKEQSAATQSDDTELAEIAVMESETFIRHMHLHASHLDGLNDALAAGDLEAAQIPAYWLLRHKEVSGHPDDWQPHIENMRNAASAVVDASDIDVARAEAQRIIEGCLGCHAAAGVDIDLSNLQLN